MASSQRSASRPQTAVLVSGRGSNMVALIEAGRQPGYPTAITCVISDRPDAPALDKAKKTGVPTHMVDRAGFANRAAFELALQQILTDHAIDYVCLAGFMQLLSADFVSLWHNRILNIHPSLLPAFRGLKTHERALAAGVQIHGCTVHLVRAAMDDGPILIQAAVPVADDDTPDSLAARVLKAEHRIFPEALHVLASGMLRVDGERSRSDAMTNLSSPEMPALIWPAITHTLIARET